MQFRVPSACRRVLGDTIETLYALNWAMDMSPRREHLCLAIRETQERRHNCDNTGPVRV